MSAAGQVTKGFCLNLAGAVGQVVSSCPTAAVALLQWAGGRGRHFCCERVGRGDAGRGGAGRGGGAGFRGRLNLKP